MENSQTVKGEEASCNITIEGLEEDKILAEEKLKEGSSMPVEVPSFAQSNVVGVDCKGKRVTEEYGSNSSNRTMEDVDVAEVWDKERTGSSDARPWDEPSLARGPVFFGAPEAQWPATVWDKEWVVEMKENFTIQKRSDCRWEHIIFRVPQWIKLTTSRQAYEPWLVSLGPYHYGHERLKAMEEHKRRAVQAIAERMGIGILVGRDALGQLTSVIDELEDYLLQAYDGLGVGNNITLSTFKQIMLMDGCFMVEIIRMYGLLKKGKECDSYLEDDPVFSRRGFGHLYLALKSDMIVMENQLPLLLLQKLHEMTHWERVENINDMVSDFLGCQCKGSNEGLALHPLELFHLNFCENFCDEQVHSTEWGDWDDTTTPSVTELAKAGIDFKKRCCNNSINAIDFQNGVLSMPEIEVNDRTEREFLNLMAFERLYGSAGSNATAFMIFMDNIIDSEKDVALLRSKGVIKNMLSSDEEAAKMFNTLSKGALLSPNSHLYSVRKEVNKYCKKKLNTWRENFRQKYMTDPIVFTAFLLSGFLLIATFLQTIYTIMSYYKQP